MGSKINTYCGANYIISSLGCSTLENYNAIESYTTNIYKYSGCGTPVCLIDRERLKKELTSSVLDYNKLNCREGLEKYSFLEQLVITSLEHVISESGVGLSNRDTLLILSTTKGNIEYIANDLENSFLWATANKMVSYFNCANTPLIYSNACISGVGATVIGKRLIEQGEYNNVYVVGVDVVSDFIVSGFNSFKSISPTICRPYDAQRDGLTLGEACGALLLTNNRELSDSKVVVCGGGISDDANHISGPSRTGDGLYFAIKRAMQEADIEVDDLSFVNTHGTATPYNDEMESKALQMAGLCGVPCNSLKPYLGHTLGASGVIEIILSLEQLKRSHLFGVKGYATSGVPFDLNVSAKHREISGEYLLKTASGFGGTNCAVVLGKEEECMRYIGSDSKNRQELVQLASCKIDSEVVSAEEGYADFSSFIRVEYKKLGKTNMKFFKMDNLCKLGYVASSRLLEGVELNFEADKIGVVIANSYSSLDIDLRHNEIVSGNPAEGASPAIFVYTLANIVAAEIAIRNGFKGELSLFIQEKKSLDFVEKYSKGLIQNGICDAVIYGWCNLLEEEYSAELKLLVVKRQ